MRSILLSAAVAVLAAGIAPGQSAGVARDPKPEEAVRAPAAAFESAWNAHDMRAFGKLLTEDVDWVNVSAGHGKGRETVEGNHARVHAGKFKDSVIKPKGACPLRERPTPVTRWRTRG